MKTEEPSARETDSHAIWVFTPSRTDPKDLEAIFVQRHELLADAVDRVRESALTGHKHHLLFVGPRGCGKTHLITLLVNRVLADESLSDRLRVAWLNEDETCTSLLDLLLKIHTALGKRYPDDFHPEQLDAAYELKPSAALEFVSGKLLAALGERTLLVAMENLDSIFDSLGDSGQKELRAFIQENPRFTLVATAQRLVDELSDRGSPFFGFFQTEHLKTLTVELAAELLGNIARIQKKDDVAAFLATSRGRSRVRALHHLSGGNHRIYIVLSQFITRESIDTLVGPFMKMVDELTPYYQERLRWLSPLQRKIVEFLCTCETTVPVKEIARRLFASQPTISSQLQSLREKGYVDSNQRGREFLYEISEPLMRICVEVKDSQNAQPIRLLVDFLRVWYEDDDLRKRQERIEPASVACAYMEAAIQRNVAEGSLRKRIFLQELEGLISDSFAIDAKASMMKMASDWPEEGILALECVIRGDEEGAWEVINEALETASDPTVQAQLLISRGKLNGFRGDGTSEVADYTRVIELPGAPVDQVAVALDSRGVCHGQAGDLAAALADFTRVIGLPGAPVDQVATALFNRGINYGQAGDLAAERADYTRVIELPGAPVDQVARALNNRGVSHGQAGDLAAALEDFTRVIELPGAPVDQRARALNNRGISHGQGGNLATARADYTRVIQLPDAPVDQVAGAH
jgi:DNA-binding transcriptional ArsR family regulator